MSGKYRHDVVVHLRVGEGDECRERIFDLSFGVALGQPYTRHGSSDAWETLAGLVEIRRKR